MTSAVKLNCCQKKRNTYELKLQAKKQEPLCHYAASSMDEYQMSFSVSSLLGFSNQ